MLSLKTLPSLPLPFPSSSRLRLRPTHLAFRPAAMSSSAGAVEHVVLFKLRPEAAAAGASGGADAMLAALRALATLPGVSHLHAGPVLRLRSPAAAALAPTHLLHSRYPSKPDLAAYASHPGHVAAVQSLVLPNALDITAVDWANSNPSAAAGAIAPGSAVRLTLAKVKDGVGAQEVVDRVAAAAAAAEKARVSFGENFSPARAKGFQFGMVAVFDSVEELDAVEGDEEVSKAKEAVRPLLDEVLVLDFVVEPSGEDASAAPSL